MKTIKEQEKCKDSTFWTKRTKELYKKAWKALEEAFKA